MGISERYKSKWKYPEHLQERDEACRKMIMAHERPKCSFIMWWLIFYPHAALYCLDEINRRQDEHRRNYYETQIADLKRKISLAQR